MVKIFSDPRYKIEKKILRVKLDSYLEKYRVATQIINVVFVGSRKMKAVAEKYKNEPQALPVLSFSYLRSEAAEPVIKNLDEEPIIGEVLICYPQAVLMAARRVKAVDDIIFELVKHGVDNIFR